MGSNFKIIGPLTLEGEEWWQSYGRHLEAARKEFDKRQPIQSRSLDELWSEIYRKAGFGNHSK